MKSVTLIVRDFGLSMTNQNHTEGIPLKTSISGYLKELHTEN